MRIGVLGTGMVGRTIGTKLVALGHEVMLGSRTPDNERAAEWVADIGSGTSQGSFAEAAAHGELLFNCTAGTASLDALGAARPEDFEGKTIVDVANALDFSQGRPPTLGVSNTDSLGEQIQRAFPSANVVKTLNTMNCAIMVEPSTLPGDHDVFVCGNHEGAKQQVVELLESFGWPTERIVDLGDITAARGTEMYLPLWLRLMGALGSPNFNVKIVR